MNTSDQALLGSYNYGLVSLSVVIAIVAAYAALDLAGRVTSAGGRVRFLWLSGGAIAMGTGIWSMHFIGMLAFRLPIPVLYDWPTVVLSLLAAVFASAIALFVASRDKMDPIRGDRKHFHGRWHRHHALHRDGSHATARDVPLVYDAGGSLRGPCCGYFLRRFIADVLFPAGYLRVELAQTFECSRDGRGDSRHALHGNGGRKFYAFCIRDGAMESGLRG